MLDGQLTNCGLMTILRYPEQPQQLRGPLPTDQAAKAHSSSLTAICHPS